MPREVLRLDGNGVQGDFETGVLDVAIVAPRSGESRRAVTAGTHDRGQRELHEHVLRHLLIPVEGESDAAVEESKIQSYVPLLLCLPLDIEVLKVGRTIADAETGVHHRHSRTPLVATNSRVTGLTPTQTELTIGEPALGELLHELLVGETPSQCQRVEACPSLVRTEVRTTIVSIGVGAKITVIIIIGFTREERSHGTRAKACTNLRVARAQCWVVHLVVGQVGIVG